MRALWVIVTVSSSETCGVDFGLNSSNVDVPERCHCAAAAQGHQKGLIYNLLNLFEVLHVLKSLLFPRVRPGTFLTQLAD